MTEQEVWEEIGKLEQAMKQMHDGLDRIIAGCSNPDARAIRYEADAMKRRISSAFEGKFALVEATSNYFNG